MFEIYNLRAGLLVDVDEIYSRLSWRRYNVHEVAYVRSVYRLPVTIKPHEILWLKLAIVLVLVKKQPG